MIYHSRRNCPFCRKRIDAQATICPYCRKDVEPIKRVSLGRMMLVAFGAFIILSALLQQVIHRESSATSTRTPEDEVAEVARVIREYGPSAAGRLGCEHATKEELEAPTTATFEWLGTAENPDTAQHFPYVTAGKVTTQNASGAMLTRGFVCYHNGQQDFRGKVVIVELPSAMQSK